MIGFLSDSLTRLSSKGNTYVCRAALGCTGHWSKFSEA